MKDFVGRTALPELTMQRVILHLFFVICLPDFVTKVDFDWAIEEKAKKKKQDFTKIKFLPMIRVSVCSVCTSVLMMMNPKPFPL